MELPLSLPVSSLLPLVLLALVILVVTVLLRLSFGRRVDYPYEPASALFTPSERSFLGVLEQAVKDEYVIFGKVRLADLLKVRRGLSNSHRQTAFNRISAKHVDFVLCNPLDLSVVAAVELDDKSHQTFDRRQRDIFIDRAFEAAGVPLIHFPVRQTYALRDVQEALARVLPQQRVASSTHISSEPAVSDQKAEVSAPLHRNRQCPKCGAEMVIRTVRKGENAGQQFLGCSAYPKCRRTLPLDDTISPINIQSSHG